MATGGSTTKASFQAVDGPNAGASFAVQYNPKSFKLDKPVAWSEHEEQGQETDLEYSHNSPAKMSADLVFDTTSDGSDVCETWVNGLLAFTNADASPSDGETANLGKQRPPKVCFTWGTFSLLGVFESINVTYTMFSSDGTPLRALVSIAMKEWAPTTYTGAAGSAGYDTAPVSMVQLKAGETLSSVALRHNTTAQALADYNGFDDLTEIPPGTPIAVPKKVA